MEPVPPPDPTAEPDGFVVVVEPGDRIHFLDWGGPSGGAPGVLLIHGLSNTAWSWAPVARRLRAVRHVVAMDLRGHGLSDSPTDGYDADTLADDVVAVAEGSGLLEAERRPRRAGRSRVRGDRRGLGGRRRSASGAPDSSSSTAAGRCSRTATGMDVDEFLRGLDEPPEVMRSMGAFLADRQAFDPATWDADQQRAARATVVETHAGKVVPADAAARASRRASGRCSATTRVATLAQRRGARRRCRGGR